MQMRELESRSVACGASFDPVDRTRRSYRIVRMSRRHILLLPLLMFLACARPREEQAASFPIPPAPTYDDAVARVARRQAADDSVVAQGGRALLLTHGQRTPRAYGRRHGLTKSPAQVRDLGEHAHVAIGALGQRLFATGDNVYIPRLPHHAERVAAVRQLSRVNADELTMFADSIVDVARGLGDSVVVAGMSAGGTITAWVAQWRADVQRAVLIAPAIGVGLLSDEKGQELVDIVSAIPNITRTTRPDTTRPDMVQGTTTRG